MFTEVVEIAGAVEQHARGSEGGVDLGIARIDVGGSSEVAQGEERILIGTRPVEAPLSIDQSLDELGFSSIGGPPVGKEIRRSFSSVAPS